MDQTAWPLFGIRVVTPRIELRYVDEELGIELADLAVRGVHDPAFMPFAVPWTDAAPEMLRTNTLKYYWQCRADTEPNNWNLPFAVIADGAVVGATGLEAKNFPILRQVETGSWLGLEYQGHGLGRELREAILHLGFAGFGATLATTGVFDDNARSLAVSRGLGYSSNGSKRSLRRGELARELMFSLSAEDWEKRLRRNDISVQGVEPCLKLLQIH